MQVHSFALALVVVTFSIVMMSLVMALSLMMPVMVMSSLFSVMFMVETVFASLDCCHDDGWVTIATSVMRLMMISLFV